MKAKSEWKPLPVSTGRLSFQAVPLKVSFPMDVLWGMVTCFKLLHKENALSPMSVTLFGIVMLVKFEHPKNDQPPMTVTLLGIVTLVKFEQP